jgi:hypothetical protein
MSPDVPGGGASGEDSTRAVGAVSIRGGGAGRAGGSDKRSDPPNGLPSGESRLEVSQAASSGARAARVNMVRRKGNAPERLVPFINRLYGKTSKTQPEKQSFRPDTIEKGRSRGPFSIVRRDDQP